MTDKAERVVPLIFRASARASNVTNICVLKLAYLFVQLIWGLPFAGLRALHPA